MPELPELGLGAGGLGEARLGAGGLVPEAWAWAMLRAGGLWLRTWGLESTMMRPQQTGERELLHNQICEFIASALKQLLEELFYVFDDCVDMISEHFFRCGVPVRTQIANNLALCRVV